MLYLSQMLGKPVVDASGEKIDVLLNNAGDEKELIDQIRVRNGNLEVVVSQQVINNTEL